MMSLMEKKSSGRLWAVDCVEVQNPTNSNKERAPEEILFFLSSYLLKR